MEIDESKFIKGFNAGYLLAEHETSIITNLLMGTQTTTSYISGMSFGQKEYELMYQKGHLKELEQLRQNKTIDKDIERD